MLIRVCGARLYSMMELRQNKDIKSKSETSVMQLIRMAKEQQEKHLLYSILLVERGGRVFPRLFATIS